jgi:ABC-type lipoprotein export system ATPase subunit
MLYILTGKSGIGKSYFTSNFLSNIEIHDEPLNTKPLQTQLNHFNQLLIKTKHKDILFVTHNYYIIEKAKEFPNLVRFLRLQKVTP